MYRCECEHLAEWADVGPYYASFSVRRGCGHQVPFTTLEEASQYDSTQAGGGIIHHKSRCGRCGEEVQTFSPATAAHGQREGRVLFPQGDCPACQDVFLVNEELANRLRGNCHA